MKREPFRALVNSVLDCFLHPYPGDTLGEMFVNAGNVITSWVDPVSWDRKYNRSIGG